MPPASIDTVHPDDEHLAELLVALRHRTRTTQKKLASLADVPRDDVIAIEAGRAGSVRLERVRSCFDTLDARLRVVAWWRGAAADRLLDERHAALVERAVGIVRSRGWSTAAEVTFSEYGERGSVDLLGMHEATGHALIGEVKATIGSLEETNRVLDVKDRLGPKIVRSRYGREPKSVSRVLILAEGRTARRIVDVHIETMESVYPARSRELRAWLRAPSGRISAIWFLSEVADTDLA